MLDTPLVTLFEARLPFVSLRRTVAEKKVYKIGALAKNIVLFLTALLFLVPPAQAADDFLEPEQAFKFSAAMTDAKTIAVTYVIADGYYMYRDRFKFSADGAKLGEPVFAPGKVKFDETFQKNVETYHGTMSIQLPVEAVGIFTLHAIGQGCAEKGLCYAPMSSQLVLSSANSSGSGPVKSMDVADANATAPMAETSFYGKLRAILDPGSNAIATALKGKKFLVILPLCFVIGLGLSFTPCVLPMVPILSFIIVGEGAQVTRRKSLVLSITYALGMALVYTALGIASGLLGEGLSAYLQSPWVLCSFSILIALLALSMFDVYQLQMPARLQQEMMRISKNQKAGKFAGVFVMGALSALILSPCVTGPLTGILLYIGQTGDALFGGYALFAIAVGMSAPLILVGISAGALLPRAGAWMTAVKRFFGVLMFAMALWIISPLAPVWLQMLAWATLLLVYGAFLLYPKNGGWLSKVFGLIFVMLGVISAGAVTGGSHQQVAEQQANRSGIPLQKLKFMRVKSISQLDAVLSQSNGKNVMLDFYADWCVACKEMEKFTFSDATVQSELANVVLLQADVTANDADDRAMLKRFTLFGPPGIILFDKKGGEIRGSRVIGYQDAERFLPSVRGMKRL